MKPELIIALDAGSALDAVEILDRLPDEITWFKVGMELFTTEGPSFVQTLTARKKRVFLDLKYHDIPNTVARAVSSAASLGVSMLTVHACGGRAMMRAAADAAGGFGKSAPKLIAVTTLTSLNDSDLADIGIGRNINDQALALADIAISSGMDGVVASVLEASSLRRRLGESAILVTPGIRPSSGTMDDQKRAASPESAVKAGSDFLVVGRPVIKAPDPRAAAEAILKEIRNAGRT